MTKPWRLGLLLLVVAACACEESPAIPDDGIQGVFQGEMLIGARLGAGSALGVHCFGPATITIDSSTGTWMMGPTSPVPDEGTPFCDDGSVFTGSIVATDSMISFFYDETDIISGITQREWEYRGGAPANSWSMRIFRHDLVIERDIDDLPRFGVESSPHDIPWSLEFTGGRQE